MMRARAWRRKLGFSSRIAFDDALRPRFQEPGTRIAYPDAIYHISVDDYLRAIAASVRGTCEDFNESA